MLVTREGKIPEEMLVVHDQVPGMDAYGVGLGRGR